MSATLADYRQIIGADIIEELRVIAGRVRHRSCQHINAEPVGGEVAGALTRLIPFMRELGLEIRWNVLKGDEQFHSASRTLLRALGGKEEVITDALVETYASTMEMNYREIGLTGDILFVHDPMPAGLVRFKSQSDRRWIWSGHTDLSHAQSSAWAFLRPLIEQYDAALFSVLDFALPMSIPQYIVPPSVDPLSERNRELSPEAVRTALERFDIDPARPIILQVARFGRRQNPHGMIAAYRSVKGETDCQLVLAGEGPADDPDDIQLLAELQAQAAADPDIHVLPLPPFSDLAINALVRGATIVMHIPLRGESGVTVMESMWKRKPVIGSAVGGIQRQIAGGFTGYLVHSAEQAARRASQLLSDPEKCRKMGENGYLFVRQNFLLTRQVKDYLLVMMALDYPRQDVIFLA